jgi:hypothetical protein
MPRACHALRRQVFAIYAIAAFFQRDAAAIFILPPAIISAVDLIDYRPVSFRRR